MRQNSDGESFPAIDRKGQPYVLTPQYRPTAVDGDAPGRRPVKRAAKDFVGIVAADGRDVRRASRGRYFLSAADGGELISLFSSDRNAV